MINNERNINSLNDSADFWYYQIGVNVITADTKIRKHMKIGYHGRTSQFLKKNMSYERRMASITKE
jgi:hypothetical protein